MSSSRSTTRVLTLHIHQCDICDQTFSTSRNLTAHLRRHTGVRPHKCNVCNAAFTTSGSLTGHMRIHTGEKPYKCSICREAFTHVSSLRKHTRIHTGEKPFKCSHCGVAFSQSGNMKRHVRNNHGDKQPIKCSVCGIGFANANALKEHMFTHGRSKPCPLAVKTSFRCAACSAIFSSSHQLSTHLCTERDDKMLQCKPCSKTFSKVSKLQQHLRLKHRECQSMCKICKAEFTDTYSLEKHMISHSGVQNSQQGNVCGNKFGKPAHLKKVVLMLAKNKPIRPSELEEGYKCKVCDETFQQRNSWAHHILSHSKNCEGKSYGCSSCESVFDQFEDLEKHVPSCSGIGASPLDANGSKAELKSVGLQQFVDNQSKPILFLREISVENPSKAVPNTPSGEDPLKTEQSIIYQSMDTVTEIGDLLEDKKPFHCELWAAPFVTPAMLTGPIFADEDEPESTAEGNDFIQSSSCSSEEEKAFSCEQCGVAFTDSTSLGQHMIAHEAHVCNICSAAFKEQVLLDSHMASHNDVETFRCNTCQLEFLDVNDCEDHMASHLTEKNCFS